MPLFLRLFAYGLYAVALTSFLSSCTPAPAAQSNPFVQRQADVCTPWARVRARIPSEAHLTEVPDTQDFLDKFNAEDPPTDVTADHVYAARRGSAVLLFFVTGECLTQNGAMPAEDFATMLGAQL